MGNEINKKIKDKLINLSNIIRAEQRDLLIEAANFNSMPNKSLLRQIAELELNITAIDNTIAEYEEE
ncbi:hypothetical protein HBA92_02000 [Ochrobactrum sp. MR28]|nr:hypothetical protein [Ochrobactrum sp. MR28]MBX8815733.1 hypothetical protein [Ochrobactrum sp. MR31]MDR2310541.1 hypothetical protein [Brucellaceae bacterium]